MADKDNNKRRTFDKVPTKICQYGADCYRKNPNHFKELSHPHLESILSESPKGKYRIPDELSMSREVVAEQLKIIAQLYPELESNPPAKQPKKRRHANGGRKSKDRDTTQAG